MQNTIGVEVGFRYLVGNQDDGNALVGELADNVVDALFVANVDACRWGIENEDFWIGGQPLGQNDALLIAAR